MTDSVQVFPPGFRVTDANDNPISGATIEFYSAETTTPKTVYSDNGLSVAIGTTVTCDSGGYPSSGGNKTLVYTGTAAYKIIIKDASGVALATHDNVKGAVVSSGTGSGLLSLPIDASSSAVVSITSADFGRIKELDTGASSIVVSLPLASTATNGSSVGVMRKTTNSNTLTIVATGTDTVAGGGSVSLTSDKDCDVFASNGANAWKLVSFAKPGLASGAITSDLLDPRVVGGLAQVGDIKSAAFETVPAGWLECDGTAVSRTTYATLFAKIGTAWGQGDGVNTFNVPDLRGLFLRGWDHGAGRDPNTAALNVTGAANNGSGLVRLTMASTATLYTGQKVTVASVGGVTAATGTWTITVVDSTHIDLQSSTFSGTYTSGGTVNARYAQNTGGATGDHVGSYETDALQAHTHSGQLASAATFGAGSVGGATTGGTTTGSSSGKSQASETRPLNANVMFIILADAAAAAGAAGTLNTIYTTSGAPSSGLGINGDFAIDSAAKMLYGPKASGSWPSGVSLAGATYATTSSTSATIGSSGSKSLTVGTGLGYSTGTRLRASDHSNPTVNYMEGVTTSYTSSTGALVFTADNSAGSGTLTSWDVNIAGDKGSTGSTGATGPANSLSIGTVTTGAAGSSAAATITGTAPSQTLNLTIPTGATGSQGPTGNTGATGPANTLTIGTVSTLSAGSSATASVTGTAPNQTLNLGIPTGATGATGSTGNTGATGAPGQGAGFNYAFATSTTMADPSAGNIRLNNATLASVTNIAISVNTADSGNPSIAGSIAGWDGSSTTANRGRLLIKKASAPQNFAEFNITGASTNNTTWYQLAVTYLSGSGSFSASDALSIEWHRTGDAGAGSISGATTNGVAYATGTTSLTSTAALTAGQIVVGQSAAAPSPVSVSGDATLSVAGALTVTKTNGTSFAASATTDTTNASNISAGTLAAARGGAGTVSGIMKAIHKIKCQR